MLAQPGRTPISFVEHNHILPSEAHPLQTKQLPKNIVSEFDTPEVEYINLVALWIAEIKEAIDQAPLTESQEFSNLQKTMNLLLLEVGVFDSVPYNCELLHAGLIRLIAHMVIALESLENTVGKSGQGFKHVIRTFAYIEENLARLHNWGVIPSEVYDQFQLPSKSNYAIAPFELNTNSVAVGKDQYGIA